MSQLENIYFTKLGFFTFNYKNIIKIAMATLKQVLIKREGTKYGVKIEYCHDKEHFVRPNHKYYTVTTVGQHTQNTT